MNWTVEYVKSQNLVKVKTAGIFTLGDQIKMIEDVISQKFWKPGLDVLVDHRKVDFDDTDVDFMRKASQNHEKYEKKIGSGNIALLMKSLTDYARGRQFELLTEKKVASKISVFTDEEKALNWLAS